MLKYEEYVELFRKKVATLEKGSPVKRRKSRPRPSAKDEEEFDLIPTDEDEAQGVSELSISAFLSKFDEVLPKNPLDRFEFLVEAHHRDVIHFLAPEERFNSSTKVVFQGVHPSEEIKTIIDFLEVFFSFSLLSKEMGISARSFPALMVNKCKDWFPESVLVEKCAELEKVSDAFFLLYTLAHYVIEGTSKRIGMPKFKKFVSAKEFLFFMQSVNRATHPLLKSNYWVMEKDMWDDEISITTNKKSISLIMPDFEANGSESYDGFELIAPGDIKPVSLYYSSSTQSSLDRLKSILRSCPPEVWENRRLGIILAGESGAGKTEFVAQACRELGFYYANVGSLNNMYVGKTEENIKRVFETEYPKLMKKYNNKVILCINEMDNLFGVKTPVTTSSAFHTNAGISQILRSLDTFKGIIVGTLNELSPERCEPAAIRRFQYLINFTLPDFEARKLIWASREGFWQQNPTMINCLAQFELSGSDIHSVCEKGFFLQFAGDEFAENALFDLISEQVELGKKTRYTKSVGSSIGFQKLAS
ncbi:AAA family ATPase [Aquirufa lenticrescens]